jgi:2-polyprenyl-3-methyl-5-hydroxy-6-metoxy-1,4-benzoquinol methylase
MHPEWRKAAGVWPVDLDQDPNLRKSFDVLRKKWGEVPYDQYERRMSADLLALSDAEVVEKWETSYAGSSTGKAFSVRGWYQTIYRDVFRGKKILDVGCGLAPDTVHYAEHGARVTFLDIVESNVRFVERVCHLKGIRDASFCHMRDLDSLRPLPADYDAIYCCGALIHAPLEAARMEAQALLRHLPVGGRWIELGYPKARWEREGRLPETEWGNKTDGGAPWSEWHDLTKLDYMLAPAVFDTVLYLEFHNADFNWFDLIRRS